MRQWNYRPVQDIAARRGGFSLVELMFVVTMLGILAATAVPSIISLDRMRNAAAADEVGRLAVLARTMAMTSGLPTAMEASAASNEIMIVQTGVPGGAISAAVGPDGIEIEAVTIPVQFAGTEIVSVSAQSADGRVWFGFDGEPRLRTLGNVDDGRATTDATVTVTGGHIVRVRPWSGTVAVEIAP